MDKNDTNANGRFPTRDDIEAAQKALQDQLDRRFNEVRELSDCKFDERDKRIATELSERDKAVAVLAETLEQKVKSGDENLLQHISNQIQQIQLALSSAELLEQERIKGCHNEVTSVHREIDIETAATKTAIQKADAANEKRFESVNEFRAQMADQSALFISRREVEAMMNSHADKLSSITDRMNRNEGKGQGVSQLTGWIFGGVGMVVGLIAIFAWLARMQPTVDRNTDFRRQTEPIIQQVAPQQKQP